MTSKPTVLGTGGHDAGNQPYEDHVYANVGLGRSPMITGGFDTEAEVSQTVRAPGTASSSSYLSWGLDAGLNAPLTLKLNKNSSATSLAVSFSTNTAGWMTDSSHSVSVSSGDSLDFNARVDAVDPVNFSGSFYCVSARFDAANDSAQMLVAVGKATLNVSITRKYLNFLGVLGGASVTDQTSSFTAWQPVPGETWPATSKQTASAVP